MIPESLERVESLRGRDEPMGILSASLPYLQSIAVQAKHAKHIVVLKFIWLAWVFEASGDGDFEIPVGHKSLLQVVQVGGVWFICLEAILIRLSQVDAK